MDLEEPKSLHVVQIQPAVSLETQLEKVVEFIEARERQGLPVKVVFGATNKESKRISDEAVIFVDKEPHDPQGRPHIQLDFNDIPQLTKFMQKIGPRRVNQWLMEDSTFKFTDWKAEHIALFASMSTEDGEFTFPIPHTPSSLDGSHVKKDADLRAALEDVNPLEDSIPKAYTLLDSVWTEEGRAEYNAWVVNGDPDDIDGQLELLQRTPNKIKNMCIDQLYHPRIMAFFEKEFKNVWIEKDVPFVIPSSFGNTSCTLLRAKNPKKDSKEGIVLPSQQNGTK